MNWKIFRQNSEGKLSTAADLTDEFSFRVRTLLGEYRRGWNDTKESARRRLARALKCSPRQVERWERGELKEPRVSVWFRVESLLNDIADRYETEARATLADMERGDAAGESSDQGVAILGRKVASRCVEGDAAKE